MRTPNTLPALLIATLLATACGGGGDAAPAADPSAATEPTGTAAAATTAPAAVAAPTAEPPAADRVTAKTVASGLRNPWSLAFLPDGRVLVTEKAGAMRIVGADGSVSAPLGGVPAVFSEGQGGLLDVVLSPDFARDATLFFTFAEPAGGGLARTAVGRAVLGDGAIGPVQVIFRQSPAMSGTVHFGARLAFAPDGTLFVGLGERGDRNRAQGLDNHLGKVVRLRTDGSVPPDNPFVGQAGALPEIWSYGHRNPQGAAIEPSTGRLWTGEHGPQGGDEVNTPARGANHGWPVITFGVEYGSGAPIGEGTARADVAPPLHVWTPTSIAPGGMAFYGADRVPGWRGDLFAGALVGRALVRLAVRDGRVVGEQRLLTDLGERIRDVKTGPDGHLYLITDSASGRLMRVELR
jgi:glucose/arabinose dehydrogenase